jgi:hypothetical protein
VKVEGCEYRLEENQILEWLSYFGEVKTNLFEDTHEESDDSSDDLPPVGNGIYSVKMKLTKDMPQLIPMHGKRVRLYYRGITKRCTNCFGTHQRKQSRMKKSLGSTTSSSLLRSTLTFPRSCTESGQTWQKSFVQKARKTLE